MYVPLKEVFLILLGAFQLNLLPARVPTRDNIGGSATFVALSRTTDIIDFANPRAPVKSVRTSWGC